MEENVFDVFTRHDLSGGWSGGYMDNSTGRVTAIIGRSGEGSTVSGSSNFRNIFVSLVKHYNIERIVDCGCGDWEWMRLIIDELDLSSYLGIDAARGIVLSNTSRYSRESNPTIEFVYDEILNVENYLEGGRELVLCRQVLEHLPRDYVEKFIEKIKKFSSFAVVGTNPKVAHNPPGEINSNTPYNLEIEPFNLTPVFRIPDSSNACNFNTNGDYHGILIRNDHENNCT